MLPREFLVPPAKPFPTQGRSAEEVAELGVPVHAIRERFGDNLPETNLAGAHQRLNAGCALLACELASGALPFDAAAARAALRCWKPKCKAHHN